MANTYTLIASGVGGSPSVTFSSIPSTYTDLVVLTSTRVGSANAGMFMKFNGSSSNYSAKRLIADTATSSDSGGSTNIFILADGNWATANTFNSASIYIPDYTSANYKSINIDCVAENNSTSGGLYFLGLFAGLWSDTSAITSIAFTPEGGGDFDSNSNFYLYGIKKS